MCVLPFNSDGNQDHQQTYGYNNRFVLGLKIPLAMAQYYVYYNGYTNIPVEQTVYIINMHIHTYPELKPTDNNY